MYIGVIALALFLFFKFTNKDNNNNKANNQNINMTNVNNNYLNTNNISGVFYNEPLKEMKEKKSNFTTILNIGVFLIILSSIIFATTNWNNYKDTIKILILGIETLLFLGLGLILKYVFKVEKSGNALTFIASMLLPATFLSAGYFKLFGDDFSLFGKYNNFFLSVTFFLETIILHIRKCLIKSKKYFVSLACFFSGIFLLTNGIADNEILSISITSVTLLITSLISKKLFKEKLEFDILNYISIVILSYIYFYVTIYQLASEDILLLRFSLVMLLVSLSINFIVNLGRKNEALNILSIMYESLLVMWFVLFSKSLIVSLLILIISSLVLYIVYYLSKNKYLSTTSIIFSYLQGLLGIIIVCFDKNYILMAPIMSFVYIILTIISSLRKDNAFIINAIFEPIYLVMFAVGILIQPSIIENIKSIDVIMVINTCLAIALIVATLLKNNIKNGYFVILAIGLFVQIICSATLDANSLIYSVITLVINAVFIAYAYFGGDSFYKKCAFPISLLFIMNILIGVNKNQLVAALLILASLVLFMFVSKNSKKRFTYASLLFIPILQFIYIAKFKDFLKFDLALLTILPFIALFVRKVIDSEDEILMCFLELFFITAIGLGINSNIITLIYLLVIYIIMIMISKRHVKSSKVYLNYLIFLTPIILFKSGNEKYNTLYMIFMFTTLTINQVLYRLMFEKRKTLFEIFHSIISLGLIVSLIETLKFSDLISAILGAVLIIVLYLVYENARMKYVILSFVIYPLSLLINYIPDGDVMIILNIFIWMIPITMFTRKVFKMDNNASVTIESIILSLMFLSFIFNDSPYGGITVGIISLISIIVGLIFKYKSYNYVGYVAIVLTILVHTIDLWRNVPWWVYLLVTGIILVGVAVIIESKKK